VDAERLGGLAVVPSRLERGDVRLGDGRLGRELLPQEAQRALDRARVHPRQQAQREHVLGAAGVLARELGARQRIERQLREVDGVDGEPVKGAVVDRVALPPDPSKCAIGEVMGVDDDRPAARQVAEVRLQRGGVHRHQHIRTIARGKDVVIGEVELEGRDPGQRPGRGADLRREVGQCREVVTEDSRFLGEAIAGQLHAIAGVPRDTDDDAI
jgi:hypothetical protein